MEREKNKDCLDEKKVKNDKKFVMEDNFGKRKKYLNTGKTWKVRISWIERRKNRESMKERYGMTRKILNE